MCLNLRLITALAFGVVMLMPVTAPTAEAAGTRAGSAAKRSLPSQIAKRSLPRQATRARLRPVAAASRVAGNGTRVAGFAQRSAAGAGGGTFVNGYSDLAFTQFRTGDFFDGQGRFNAGQ